jgi:hypothetical protein
MKCWWECEETGKLILCLMWIENGAATVEKQFVGFSVSFFSRITIGPSNFPPWRILKRNGSAYWNKNPVHKGSQ